MGDVENMENEKYHDKESSDAPIYTPCSIKYNHLRVLSCSEFNAIVLMAVGLLDNGKKYRLNDIFLMPIDAVFSTVIRYVKGLELKSTTGWKAAMLSFVPPWNRNPFWSASQQEKIV